jgi:23S rRNA (adenine2030-N6)-methyltransferase
MNYRHAFHAGNFGDCMKHALLVWLLDALHRKPAPLFVLDSHAGAGAYDLTGAAAQRSREARSGIIRLLEAPADPALERYLTLVRQLGLYPGSPALIRALLGPDDRLVCCERHPDEAASLRRHFGRDRQSAVHHRDAWEALGALLPPREKRALVLIDPPFEDPGEFSHLTAGLAVAHARFRTGVFAAWYPIKHRTPVRAFHAAVLASAIRDVVTAELLLREPLEPSRLNGCGLLVINPPYRFETEAPPILHGLLRGLGCDEPGAAVAMTRLVHE